MKTPTLEQKVAEFLMSHGCLKMADALRCARQLIKMIQTEDQITQLEAALKEANLPTVEHVQDVYQISTLKDRLQAVEKERNEYSTALAMIIDQPPKYAKPIAEAALKVSEAEAAQFIKEYREGKHPLSKEDEAALERSRPELMRRLKALQPAQKEQ